MIGKLTIIEYHMIMMEHAGKQLQKWQETPISDAMTKESRDELIERAATAMTLHQQIIEAVRLKMRD